MKNEFTISLKTAFKIGVGLALANLAIGAIMALSSMVFVAVLGLLVK